MIEQTLQELWAAYLLENPSNNMMLNKVRRSAFYAGGRAVRDEIKARVTAPPVGLHLVPGDDDA